MALLQDFHQFQSFVNHVLPKGRHVIQLVARKKYNSDLPSQVRIWCDEVDTNTSILWEVNKPPPVTIPWNACVWYITTNPRDNAKVLQLLTKHCITRAFQEPHAKRSYVKLVKSCLMNKAVAIKTFVTLDIDDTIIVPELVNLLTASKVSDAWTVVTHGGYHILIKLKGLTTNQRVLIFKHLPRRFPKPQLSVNSDMMCPVPGTLQGGKLVQFYRGLPKGKVYEIALNKE